VICPTAKRGKQGKMKGLPDSDPTHDTLIVEGFQELMVDSWKLFIPHGESCSLGSRSCEEFTVMQQDLGGGLRGLCLMGICLGGDPDSLDTLSGGE
jgi:hypothetical protein